MTQKYWLRTTPIADDEIIQRALLQIKKDSFLKKFLESYFNR